MQSARMCSRCAHAPAARAPATPQVAFLALAEVAPVTHAVTNTVKRVVIIVATTIVFKTTISPLGAMGSGITIIGALLYGIAKNNAVKRAPRS